MVHGERGLLVVLPGGTELQERVVDAEKRGRGGLKVGTVIHRYSENKACLTLQGEPREAFQKRH